ncbi:MAG: hypothetical protein ABR548_09095 [Actinomycetota bacterium]
MVPWRRILSLSVIVGAMALQPVLSPAEDLPGSIKTIAGGGTDEGVPAASANLLSPGGIALTSAGSIVIADTGNDRIRSLGTAGTVTTLGPRLSAPADVALDGAGNALVTDTDDNMIKKIDAAGHATTIAGSGEAGFGGDGGPAVDAKLNHPSGIAVDATGNIFIGDTTNNRIRKIDSAGVISTIAGTGEAGAIGDGAPATAAQLSGPRGLTIDASGLYITDTGNSSIRKIDSTGNINFVSGGVAACLAWSGSSGDTITALTTGFCSPADVAVDSTANIFVSDTGNNRIRKIDSGGTTTTVAGLGTADFGGDGLPAQLAQLQAPAGIAVNAIGDLFVADAGNARIRKIDASGSITTIAGGGAPGGDGGPATNALLPKPAAVAIDGTGTVYIADAQANSVRKIDATGVIATIAGDGRCTYAGDGGQASAASLCKPQGLVLDGAGTLYIADTGNHRVRKIDATGVISTLAGHGCCPLIANPLPIGDDGPALAATLLAPTGLAVDTTGVYIADTQDNRIRKVDPSGMITTIAGTGANESSGDGGSPLSAAVAAPRGLALGAAGTLYIAEAHRIRKIATDVISTIAGDGSCGFAGDGDTAVTAKLCAPTGVATDATGNVFVADSGNYRLRLINPDGVVNTVGGTGARQGTPATQAFEESFVPAALASTATGNVYIVDAASRRVLLATTPALAPARPVPTVTVEANDKSVTLSWTRPAGFDFAGVIVRMAEGNTPPATPADGTLVYQGRDTTATKPDLLNCGIYSFAVFAYSRSQSFSDAKNATGMPVPETPQLTMLTASLSPVRITYGATITLTGTLASTTESLAGRTVDAFVKPKGAATEQKFASPVTDSGGAVRLTHKPLANGEYTVEFAGTPCLSASAATKAVQVAPKLTAKLSPTSMALGKTAKISGSILPAHAGQAIALQQYVSGRWKTIKTVRLSSSGAYVFSVKPVAKGTLSYRVLKDADTDHLAVQSATLKLKVT